MRKIRWKFVTRPGPLIFLLLAAIILLLASISPAFLTGGCVPVLLPVHVSIPIDLSKAGNVAEAEFRLWCYDQYELKLDFLSSMDWAESDKKLLVFLGDREHKPGTIIPIRLTIYKLNDKAETAIIDKEIATKGVNGVGQKIIGRGVTIVRQEAGKYKIRIENKNDFPELVNIPVFLTIEYFRR